MPLQAKEKLVILRMCAEGLLHAVGYRKAGDRKTVSKTCMLLAELRVTHIKANRMGFLFEKEKLW